MTTTTSQTNTATTSMMGLHQLKGPNHNHNHNYLNQPPQP